MPFLRPPLSRTRKPRRGPVFYLVVIVLPVVIAGVGAGYGVSSLVKSRRAWLERSARTVAALRVRYADLRARHPDLPPGDPGAALQAFFALPLPRQARDLEDAEAELVAARAKHRELVGPSPLAAPLAGTRAYKTFSPNGFRAFYDALEQEDLTPAVTGAPITGNGSADSRITGMASARGYRPRPVADEEMLLQEAHYRMHGPALAAFHALRDAARTEGYELGIVSAYRSVELQRQNWVYRLGELALELRRRSVTAEEIAQGEADDVVEAVLTKNAIPGYSKHHTGYTMDIEDRASGKVFTDFGETEAFRWLSADNYANAKRFGFLPSYPPGAVNQGPDPEPWEYVWVGEEILREEW